MLNKTGEPDSGIPAKYTDSILAWDKQVRLFAQYFLAHANLPQTSFTLLDIGCGTGAALRVIKEQYPRAALFGCDFHTANLEISKDLNGNYATFFKSDFYNINCNYDIIYISNVLEHLRDWKAALSKVLTHGKEVYILVPYREHINSLSPDLPETDQHVNSFNKKSFVFLNAGVFRIKLRVIRTPYAWGHPLRREFIYRIKAFLLRRKFEVQRELLVSIRHAECNRNMPFKSRFRALLEYLKI